jgi:hypothetical protein
MTWILAIAALTYDGHAITSIPGFKTEKDCRAAAAIAVSQLQPQRYGVVKVACLPQP